MNTNLRTVPFGRTGMDITRVGFGAWAAGGAWRWGWGAQDDDASIAAIHRALELGINWIDTAPVYGWGHSEEVVARALASYSDADRPYVFTKCGMRREPDGEAFTTGTPAWVREEVENSLRRLKVERLDLLQMHWPTDDESTIEDYWGTMIALRDEGKVAHIGLCNHRPDELDVAEAMAHVETMQPPFSAVRRETAAEILPWCQAHDTGVIVYSPMQAGLLTGAFSRDRLATLDETDWRRGDDEFTVNLDRNLELADAFGPVAERHGVTRSAAAAAWTLAWPGVTAAIVGARSAAQVDGWIQAAELELDDTDLAEIAAAITRTGAGSGPAMP